MKARIRSRRHNQGYSLLEVLITVLIMSFGLLGLAGLQMKGLNYSHGANLRLLATQQAYDMTDRMRANMAGMLNGNYDNISASIPGDPGCVSSYCSPAQMATYDAFRWNTDNAALLPSGRGTVTRSVNIFTVTVSWDDERSGTANKSFSVRFEP